MSFFQEVEGDAAILVDNGVYRQVPLYKRDGYLYAKHAGGFVRLMADGSTSRPKLRLEFMSISGSLFRDNMGRMCVADRKGSIPLEEKRAQMLLGGPTE